MGIAGPQRRRAVKLTSVRTIDEYMMKSTLECFTFSWNWIRWIRLKRTFDRGQLIFDTRFHEERRMVVAVRNADVSIS